MASKTFCHGAFIGSCMDGLWHLFPYPKCLKPQKEGRKGGTKGREGKGKGKKSVPECVWKVMREWESVQVDKDKDAHREHTLAELGPFSRFPHLLMLYEMASFKLCALDSANQLFSRYLRVWGRVCELGDVCEREEGPFPPLSSHVVAKCNRGKKEKEERHRGNARAMTTIWRRAANRWKKKSLLDFFFLPGCLSFCPTGTH